MSINDEPDTPESESNQVWAEPPTNDAPTQGERAVSASGDTAGAVATGDDVSLTQVTFTVLPDQAGRAPGCNQLLAHLDAVMGKVSTPEARAAVQTAREALAGDDQPKTAENNLRDVTLLLAQGLVLWQPETSAAGLDNAEHVIVSMAASALWPLVVARTLNAEQCQALAALASDEVARAVMMARAVNPNKQPDKAAHQLAQNLLIPAYLPGLARLLGHLRDPELGYPALCAARLLRNQPPPVSAPRDAGDIVREALKWAGLAAVAGIIGNRSDALFGQTVQAAASALQPTASPLATAQPAATARPTRLARATGIDVLDQMAFCWVPEGEFWMGAANHDKTNYKDERPIHRVLLSAYAIGRYPVTNALFEAFVRATGHVTQYERDNYDRTWRAPSRKGSTLAGKALHPVRAIAWGDAQAFCRWLSERCGLRVGLPSEAQLEKAARGGLQLPPAPIVQSLAALEPMPPVNLPPNSAPQRTYPWGETPLSPELCNIWFDKVSERVGDTTPIGHYASRGDSPYGCCDMIGNIWEWCQDWYDDDAYTARQGRDVIDPVGPATGTYRVLRGGSFNLNQYGARCAYRGWYQPGHRTNYVGFRVCVSPTSR